MNLKLLIESIVERCEYSATARFWNIAFLDGYEYMSPYGADQYARYSGAGVSTGAIASGYWQVVRYAQLGHFRLAQEGAVVVAEARWTSKSPPARPSPSRTALRKSN